MTRKNSFFVLSQITLFYLFLLSSCNYSNRDNKSAENRNDSFLMENLKITFLSNELSDSYLRQGWLEDLKKISNTFSIHNLGKITLHKTLGDGQILPFLIVTYESPHLTYSFPLMDNYYHMRFSKVLNYKIIKRSNCNSNEIYNHFANGYDKWFLDKHINYLFQKDVFFDKFTFNDTAKLNVVKIIVDSILIKFNGLQKVENICQLDTLVANELSLINDLDTVLINKQNAKKNVWDCWKETHKADNSKFHYLYYSYNMAFLVVEISIDSHKKPLVKSRLINSDLYFQTLF